MEDLKICPHDKSHEVLGGYPVYVCTGCPVEWTISPSGKSAIYTHFDRNGEIVRKWKRPLDTPAKARKLFLAG